MTHGKEDQSSPAGQPDSSPENDEGRSEGPSALVMLVVAVLLVGGGYLLSMKLADMSRLQDCVMSGRTNCAPIQAGGAGR